MAAARHLVALSEDASQRVPVEALTSHERRILKLFADGNNSASIARKLGISAQTLRNHLHHINRMLRTHSRLEAVTTHSSVGYSTSRPLNSRPPSPASRQNPTATP